MPCLLYRTTCARGCSDGHGQISGAVVTRPLIQFKKLTGKDEALSSHGELKFHEISKLLTENFETTITEHRKLDIVSQLDQAYQTNISNIKLFVKAIKKFLANVTSPKKSLPING